MNYFFGPHIYKEGIRMNPPLDSNSKWRYSLDIPFKNRLSDGPVAYVIMKNPSQAGIVEEGLIKSDMTVNKVCIYFYVRGFSKVVILNLASLYATYLSNVDHSSIDDIVSPINEPKSHDQEIHRQLRNFRSQTDIVAVGWGDKNKVRGSRIAYDNRIAVVLNIIRNYTKEIFKYPSDLPYPIHPANNAGWHDWEELVPY
ncbi:DUF1643 domain-containing protein [Bacillus sp. NA_165.1]|uniref:DUF1643 domain-containing protein n=1 Tax=unclassified Bacillus (in: firmicutes) TaxID=185979 RepID=UPI0040465052